MSDGQEDLLGWWIWSLRPGIECNLSVLDMRVGRVQAADLTEAMAIVGRFVQPTSLGEVALQQSNRFGIGWDSYLDVDVEAWDGWRVPSRDLSRAAAEFVAYYRSLQNAGASSNG